MFVNQRLGYKSIIKKHGAKKLLKMYMKGEVTLNKKEWKDLHRRLERKRMFKEKISIINFGICFLIIGLFVYKITVNDFDKIERCNKIENHYCTKEELEKVIDK